MAGQDGAAMAWLRKSAVAVRRLICVSRRKWLGLEALRWLASAFGSFSTQVGLLQVLMKGHKPTLWHNAQTHPPTHPPTATHHILTCNET